MKKFFLIISLLGMTQLSASQPYDCQSQCDYGCMTVGADLLIWTLCQDTFFRAENKKNSNETFILNQDTLKYFDYDWTVGWRAHIDYDIAQCEGQVVARFTHWDNERFLAVNNNFPSGKVEFKYNTVDILYRRNCDLNCCCMKFSPFFGYRALWLDQRGKYCDTVIVPMAPAAIDLFQEKSRIDLFGNGIYAGSEFSYDLCGGVKLWSTLGISILEAKNDFCFDVETLDTSGDLDKLLFDVLKGRRCCPLTGLNFQAGLAYSCARCVCGNESLITLKIGYEFQQWDRIGDPINLLDLDSLENNRTVVGQLNLEPILLHGVTIGVDINY